MKILIVSATEKEIIPVINSLKSCSEQLEQDRYLYNTLTIDFLVTGIGQVFTIYYLIQKLNSDHYDFVINVGIAGSFSEILRIGDVVQVINDQFADLGIEDESSISTVFEKGFMSKNTFPFKDGIIVNQTKISHTLINDLNSVSAITVNTTHGKEETITLFREKFNADIETMEGAAFFYGCSQYKVKFLQLRSISNFVKPRKIACWNISLAIENLNRKLFELLVVLDTEQII